MPTCFFRSLAIAAAGFVCLSHAAAASTPRFWQISTQTDFLKGEVQNLSIDGDGRLLLGPATELVYESSAPFLWTLLAAPDGSIYAGSGNEGKVFKIDRSGKAATFFDANELEVHALALAPGGGIYVGTSPEGRIYKVSPDGTATTFFDPEDKYIWALAVAADGTVYAATGDKGIIYKISPDGKGQPFYRTKATHVTTLAFDRSGRLLAGTGAPGRVFRIESDGRAFVLLDSSFQEVHSLLVDEKGVVFVAAVSGRPSSEERPTERPTPEPPKSAPVPSVSTEITAITIADVTTSATVSAAGSRREDRRSPKGAVYRIAPDGLWDTIWESTEDSPYDVALDGSGLLVGTGNKGKIYRLAGEPTTTTLVGRAPAQQITMFLRDGKGQHYYATSNPGKLFKLSSNRAEQGSYESEVKDATTVSAWGSIRWHGTTPAGSEIQLFTRSGNTSIPDETWSPWTGAYKNPDGEQIKSPNARYLQWKAVLSGKSGSPILTSATTAYLQRNLRPQITSITVHPAGTVFQKPFSTGELELAGYDNSSDGKPSVTAPPTVPQVSSNAPPLGRRVYQKGLQTFVWKAEDDNDDRLQYDVLYRREGETTWKTLKRALDEPILVWDTTSVPDGTYVIKIVATDAPSNSPGTALTGEVESASFDIDNTPPQIEVIGVRRDGNRSVLGFKVRDDQSPVLKVEYSLDANRWRVIYPKDGIADSRLEEFEIALEGETNPRNIIIRATDAMNNVTTAVGGR